LKLVSVEKVTDSSDKTGWIGKVKEVTVEKTSYSERFGEMQEGEHTFAYRCTFDPQGNLLSVLMASGKLVNTGETLKQQTTYAYDDKGNCTTASVDDPLPDFDMTIKYNYDARGMRTERTPYTMDGQLINKTRYIHTDAGKPSETLMYDGSGKLEGKTIYTYTKDGKLQRLDRVDGTGQTTSYRVYEYDNSGKLQKESVYRIEEEWVSVGGRMTAKKVNTLVGEHRTERDTTSRIKEEFDSFVSAGLDSGLERMGGWEIKRTYIYDSSGNLSTKTFSQMVSEFGQKKWKPFMSYHYKLTYHN